MNRFKEQPLEQLLGTDCFGMFHGGIILSVPLKEDLLGWGCDGIVGLAYLLFCAAYWSRQPRVFRHLSRSCYTCCTTKLLGGRVGVYCFHSICLSVRPSHMPCLLCSGYIGFTPSVHPSVCPACRVRSVTPTVLDGFFPYVAQMITSIIGVSCGITFDLDLYLQGHSAMTLQ